ncbi:MAG TPA: SMC-Scp complex subunit ScpB [Micromonosporaceae bacterium]|nr:SMC-Scp complex subunit ScpB [Micromonosporaceae bacterium]
MTPEDDQDRDSLAERTAAWVPPWQRPMTATDEDSEPAEDGSADADDEAADADDQPSAAAPELRAELESVDSDEIDDITATAGEGAVDGEADGQGELEAEADGQGDTDDDASAQVAEPPVAEREPLTSAELGAAIEAILLVVDEPVTDEQLASVLDLPTAHVTQRLEELAAEYTAGARGFDLRRAAGGWRLYTRGDYATYVERFVLDGQSARLTQAALETLAVIAYRQPVTRSRISAIRGVNCDGVVRTLVTRGLVEECGTQPETGAVLYRTTNLFLEKLGLDSVGELPPLAPFLPDDVDGLTDADF